MTRVYHFYAEMTGPCGTFRYDSTVKVESVARLDLMEIRRYVAALPEAFEVTRSLANGVLNPANVIIKSLTFLGEEP